MKKNLLKYWHRIIHLPNTKLVRQCYNALLADGAKDQFTAAIKNILFENNLESTWTNQEDLYQGDPRERRSQLNNIINQIHYSSKSALADSSQKESKLQHFHLTSSGPGISEYLLLVKKRESRSCISKIRSGVLDLAIETGRRKNIKREARSCTQCNNTIIEDELHFMFDCSAYIMERHHFLEKCSEHISNINSFSNLKKYISIMKCSNSSVLNLFGTFITQINNIRKVLLKC